jgi:hypothetical protein
LQGWLILQDDALTLTTAQGWRLLEGDWAAMMH